MFKEKLILEIAEKISLNNASVVLDYGSGTSSNFLALLKRLPNLTYIGIEPDSNAVEQARQLFAEFPNTRFINQLGYELPSDLEGSADLVISLSVLEHIKHLEPFLVAGILGAKPGAMIVHCYDHGHVLYPSSLKERLQVFLSRYLPIIMPENKYVAYVPPSKLSTILDRYGVNVERTTHHQMPSHKQFLKYFTIDTPERLHLVQQLIAWEESVSDKVAVIPERERELLFPTVCIWSRKLESLPIK